MTDGSKIMVVTGARCTSCGREDIPGVDGLLSWQLFGNYEHHTYPAVVDAALFREEVKRIQCSVCWATGAALFTLEPVAAVPA